MKAPINEIWWVAVNPSGLAVWPYLDLRRRDVIELLDRNQPDWKTTSWRVAKLHVMEVRK